MTDIEKAVSDWAESNGITLKSIFVPFSVSRNREEKMPSLNYIVHLQSGRNSLSTDYMKGCGHLAIVLSGKSSYHISVDKRDLQLAIKKACETGKYEHYAFSNLKIKRVNGKVAAFPVPNICEVLYSLMLDSDVSNYYSFRDWAECTGYDSDSIQAKKIYEACQDIAENFNKLLTSAQREELQELLQDY